MIKVRRAEPTDADAVAEVHVRAHEETYRPMYGGGYRGPDLAARRALWRRALGSERTSRPGAACVAVAPGGRIVGFGHVLPDAVITALYVLAAHHRRGVGRELLTRLFAHAREAGHGEARLRVHPSNARAIAFYAARGGREVGREVDPRDGVEDVVLVFDLR